jgi:DNA-binding IclR family transcriptional regulator
VVDGDAVVYIHKEEGTLAVKMTAQLGTRRPLHCTALGKAYLAALPGQELEARLTGLELTRFTASTITDPAAQARLRGSVRPSAGARPAARLPGSTAPTWSGSG